MKKLFLLLLTVFIVSLCASAQTRTVHGTVLDAADDEPLIGVSVSAGTGYGAATDVDGKFTIAVPASTRQLIVSYVGYQTKHVDITSDNLTIRLETANELLDEVIAVAYGEQKRSSFTGSAAVVGSATIEKTQVTNVLDALNGKVAGLQMSNSSGAPGSSNPTMRVRGFSSIQAGNQPLIIVDGAPFTSDLNQLNTNDIESMVVLKDAASNALYGARGANGVILITTKRGKLGDAVVTVDAKWGSNSRASQDYNYVKNPAQYYELYYQSLYNPEIMKGATPAQANAIANARMLGNTGAGLGYMVYNVPAGQNLIGINGKLNPLATVGNTVTYKGVEYFQTPDNWLDEVYKTGFRQEYNLSVSQATEKSNFFASVSYLDNGGIIISPSDYKRFTGRLRADIQAKPWLKVGANVGYSHYSSDQIDSNEEGNSASTGNIFAFATGVAPIYPLYLRDAKGNIMRDDLGHTRFDYGEGSNGGSIRPVFGDSNAIGQAMLDKTKMNGNNFTINAFAEIRFLKDFKFTTNNNINFDETSSISTVNPWYGAYAESKGIISKQHDRLWDYTYQQLLNWNHTFAGVHNASVMVGHEWYSRTIEALYGTRNNMFDPDGEELNVAITYGTPGSSQAKYNTEGWFGRAQYDYDNTYFVSASYRRDASSRFHPKHRWGNFWSVGAAWMMNKENWLKDRVWIDELKLKVSYGEQGNDNIGDFRYTNIYSIVNSNGTPAVTASAIRGNENITWEKGGNLNAGVEFSFWNARLSGTFDGFYRKTSDMLMVFPMPLSSGFSGYYANVGDMTNAGIEIELNGDIIRTRDFRWSLGLNMTWYKNRISRLPEERKLSTVDGVGGYSSSNFYYGEGKPMYTFYTKRFAGVDPETGESLYWAKDYADPDNTNSEVIGHHKTKDYNKASFYLGDTALAPVYGGFNTSFEYKGFDLSFAFNYQIGGKVYDSGYASMMASPTGSSRGGNFHADLFKAWTPDNRFSNIPRLFFGDNYSAANTDRFITDASYLSLDNINFGYTIPSNVVKKLYLSKVRVYFAADNIWVWSKRQGLDPRQSFTGSPNISYYAPIRTFSGGLNIAF